MSISFLLPSINFEPMTITSPSLCSYISNCARDKPHIDSCLKAHVHPRCIARPVLQEKTFRVVENRCLNCVESIFVNLPQFAKSGLKESLNRFFWYFSLHLFGYFGVVSSLFLSVSVCFHCSTFDGGAIETYGWKSASTGIAEVHSPP